MPLTCLTSFSIPIVIAIIVLIFLHRRHVKKLAQEDLNDPHKSLDFGLDDASKKPKNGPPEMALNGEKGFRKEHGLSLDMDVASPYIMPAGLNQSHDSLHSMSRTTTDQHDPYRPVTFLKDDASIRTGTTQGRPRPDNGSIYTMSSVGTRNRMGDGLLNNAQRMSQSRPLRAESLSPLDREMPEIDFPKPVATSHSPLDSASSPEALYPGGQASSQRASVMDKDELGFSLDSPPLPESSMPPRVNSPPLQDAKSPVKTTPSPPPFPRIKSQEASVVLNNANTASFMSDSSYGEGFKITPPSPPLPPEARTVTAETEVLQPQPKRESYLATGLGADDPGFNPNRLSMSVRPLPPDDPNEDPEVRANRIRSFYKEYFDDSKPEPYGGYDYYEDYGSEYLDGTVFDPETGAFVVAQKPFAEPVTRRAMTPPPRAPPRFRGAPGHKQSGSSASSARFMPPPRGMSSMSGQMPRGPRKPLPPPAALSSLPTPHALKDDSMLVNPIDFAPPVSYRDRQAGRRPDSPLGSPRPYSPAFAPHTPLASAFDEMTPMPSP